MNQNLIKGMLIILVMFDHNEFAHQLFPLFLDGFAFHVLGFLALPFLRPPEPASKAYFQKIIFRYYYPFFLITCAMAILTMVIAAKVSPGSIGNLLLALYSGNNDILKTVAQMALLWFLPSLLSVLIFRTFLASVSVNIQRLTLLLVVVAHFFVGTVAEQIHNYLPLGLLPAIYVIPLCYILIFANQLLCKYVSPARAVLISSGFFVLVKYSQIQLGLSQEIGFALVSDFSNLLALFVNDLESVSGALMLFQLSRLKLPVLLERCGNNTLPVYLIHPFVALFIFKLLGKLMPQSSLAIMLCISMLLTILLSVGIAKMVMQNKMARRFCFPKDYDSFVGRN